MKIIRAGNAIYNLYFMKGMVSINKHSAVNYHIKIKETHQLKQYSPAIISVMRKEKIASAGPYFITGRNGKTQPLLLSDIDLVCFDHDELVAVWAVAATEKRGPFIAIKNLSTSQSFFSDSQLKKMYRKKWIYPVGIFLSSIPGLVSMSYSCTLVIMLIALPVAYCLKQYLAHLWADQFKKNFDFDIW